MTSGTSHKHAWTKGPWKWHWRHEDGLASGSVYSELRAGLAYAVAICPKYQTREQWEADAPILSAAPEMYDALKAHDIYMSDQFADGPDSRALHPDASANWKRVRAALTKAEGGAG